MSTKIPRTKSYRLYEQLDNKSEDDFRIADKEAKDRKKVTELIRRKTYRLSKLSLYPIWSNEYGKWLNASDADIDNAMALDANITNSQLRQGYDTKFLDQYAAALSYYRSLGNVGAMNLTTQGIKSNPRLATLQYSFVESDPATKIVQTAGLTMLGKSLVKPAWSALKITGQALTPSNWVAGTMDTMGYNTPNWFINGMDIATTGYFANEARKGLLNEGLNLGTATNAVLSVVPFTRDEQAIRNISHGLRNMSKGLRNTASKVKKFIPSKETNWSINRSSTIPDFVGHKNPASLKRGSLLIDNYNLNGLLYKITTDIKTGEKFYTAPNKYGDYTTYPAPPDASLSDIKEILNKKHLEYIDNLNLLLDFKYLTKNSFNKLDLDKSPDRTVVQDFENSDVSGTKAGDIILGYAKRNIDDIFLSDEYITRYLNSLKISPNNRDFRELARARLLEDLYDTYDKAKPVLYNSDPYNNGISLGSRKNDIFYYGVNGNRKFPTTNEDIESTILHEFGHNIWKRNTKFGNHIVNYNKSILSGDNSPDKHLLFNNLNPDYIQFMQYLSDPNEFSLRIREGVRYGIQNNLTPEEIYNLCNISLFKDLKYYFSKDYLIKMLGSLLTTSPIILNKND